MNRPGRLIAAAACWAIAVSSLAGCSVPTSPDYQSIVATKPTTTSSAAPATKPVPLSEYLGNSGVAGKQVDPFTLPELTVTLPTPPGWTRFTHPKISPETVLLSKGGKYPSARLVAFALRGEFDTTQAIKHANDDAMLFTNYRRLDSSDADVNGFPASTLQCSYDDTEGTRLHSWNRIVLPTTGSGSTTQRYLVQLTITSLSSETVAQSDDVEAMIRGFMVAAKK